MAVEADWRLVLTDRLDADDDTAAADVVKAEDGCSAATKRERIRRKEVDHICFLGRCVQCESSHKNSTCSSSEYSKQVSFFVRKKLDDSY